MAPEDARIGIAEVELAPRRPESGGCNPAVLDAIANADLIAFGPGSLYTSILPHLLVNGLVPAIEKASCPAVLIGNILQCRETTELTLEDVLSAVDMHGRKGGAAAELFTSVLANRMLLSFEKTVGTFAYLRENLQGATPCLALSRVNSRMPWNRGQHDGDAIAVALLNIASGGASDARRQ